MPPAPAEVRRDAPPTRPATGTWLGSRAKRRDAEPRPDLEQRELDEREMIGRGEVAGAPRAPGERLTE